LDMAIENLYTEPEDKPLGVVQIECYYPVVTLALKEILKEEAEVQEGRKRHPGTEHPSCVILCPNGKDVALEVRRLRSSTPASALLVFEMRVDPHLALKALRAGASGFIHAGMHPAQIVQAVRRASEGKGVVMHEGLLEELVTEESATDLTILTPRQQEIMQLVVEGLSNVEIAKRLFLTESTVKQHLRATYKLLKVQNRTQAAMLLRDA
jgi:DNA-binding NarL/FixJ family response regulator